MTASPVSSFDASTRLYQRLLLSLGFATGCSSVPNTGDCEPPPTAVVTVSRDPLLDTALDTATPEVPLADCPTDYRDAINFVVRSGEPLPCEMGNDFHLQSQAEAECTYEYTCNVCCGYGRPFLDADGAPVKAEAASGPGWDGGPHRPRVVGLSPGERAEIGRYWLENARAEHSSVAGFHRFALDLLTHGAPPELIARAQRAAAQELVHALDCFTLASAYLGHPVGPAPLGLGTHAPIAASLAQLAAWTLRDGAIGETLAAHLAGRAMAGTSDPAVRAVLANIVRDETEHAELAWAALQWALAVGGDEVRDAVRAVLAGLAEPTPHAGDWTPRHADHGVPSPVEEVQEAKACIARVVLPLASALLGGGRVAA